MDTKIEVSISKMEQSRARLNTILAKVAPQAEIYPAWKLKQVYDHIAGWDVLVYTTLQDYSRGEAPSTAVKGGINRYNAESVSERKALSLEQSRQAYEAARERVIQVLSELSPEMLTQKYPAPWGGMCTVNSIVKIFVAHEQEHAKQIEAILNKSTATA
jgi:hypothetical protein